MSFSSHCSPSPIGFSQRVRSYTRGQALCAYAWCQLLRIRDFRFSMYFSLRVLKPLVWKLDGEEKRQVQHFSGTYQLRLNSAQGHPPFFDNLIQDVHHCLMFKWVPFWVNEHGKCLCPRRFFSLSVIWHRKDGALRQWVRRSLMQLLRAVIPRVWNANRMLRCRTIPNYICLKLSIHSSVRNCKTYFRSHETKFKATAGTHGIPSHHLSLLTWVDQEVRLGLRMERTMHHPLYSKT